MSLRVPLAVRVTTRRADQHITRQLSNLRFRDTAPGGFAGATFELDRPLNVGAPELQQYGRCYVYDGRTGETVWEGWQEDPGRAVGPDGQVWRISAVGPSARAGDVARPYCYIDRAFERWYRADNTTPGGQVDIGENPGIVIGAGEQAMTFRFPQGLTVTTDSRVAMRYILLADAGQLLAACNYRWDAGDTNSIQQIELTVRDSGLVESSPLPRTAQFNTAGQSGQVRKITTDWDTTRVYADLRIRRLNTTGTVTTDGNWAGLTGIYIMGSRYSAAGAQLTAAASYTDGSVLASEVVADVVGRLMGAAWDGARAVITTSSYPIDQLCFPDPVTALGILGQLAVLEPGYTWYARESTEPFGGKARFSWAPWPSTVRYEASAVDGFDDRSAGADLFSAVTVRYTDDGGRIRTLRRTQTVAQLTDAGITREAWIDLDDSISSAAGADRAATQFLLEHAVIPNAGVLTLARPVLDLQTGRMVPPYLVRSGSLIRLRGVAPTVDTLNPSGRDGTTIFRIAGLDYDADTAAASVELDTYPRTVIQALKRISNTGKLPAPVSPFRR